jgi:hypothetical protein
MLRSSARSRRRVTAATPDAKLAGSLRPLAASTMANISSGRRPKKNWLTSGGVSGMPMRVNSSAATLVAICSLSTSTPLQSKMITIAPRSTVLRCPRSNAPNHRITIGIVCTWQKSGIGSIGDYAPF